MAGPVVPAQYIPRGGRNGRDGSNGADGMNGMNQTLDQLLSYIMSDEMLSKKLAAEKELATISGEYGLKQQGLANEGLLTAEGIRAKSNEKVAQTGADAQKYMADVQAEAAAASLAWEKVKHKDEVLQSLVNSDAAYNLQTQLAGTPGGPNGNQWTIYTDPQTGKPTLSSPTIAGIKAVSRGSMSALVNFLDQTITGASDLQNAENIDKIAKKVSDFKAQADQGGRAADTKRDQLEGQAAYVLANLPAGGWNPNDSMRGLAAVFHPEKNTDGSKATRGWNRVGESIGGILGEDEKTIWGMIGNYTDGGSRPMTNAERTKFEDAVEKLGAGPASVGELYETFDMALQSAIAEGDSKKAEALRPIVDSLVQVPHATYYKQLRATRQLGETLATPTGGHPFNAALMQATITQALGSPAGEQAFVEAGAPPGAAARMSRQMRSLSPQQSMQVSAAMAKEGERELNDLQQVLMANEVQFGEDLLKESERYDFDNRISHYTRQLAVASQSFGADNPAVKFYKQQVDGLTDQYRAKYGELPGGYLSDPNTIIQRAELAGTKAKQQALGQHQQRQQQAVAQELARQQVQQPQPITPVVETTTKYAPPPTAAPATPGSAGGSGGRMQPSIQAGFQPQQPQQGGDLNGMISQGMGGG